LWYGFNANDCKTKADTRTGPEEVDGDRFAGREVPLAMSFARKGSGKFNGVRWVADHGVPRLTGVPGWLVCDVAELVDGGDHVIVLGTVLAAETADDLPLTYHRRSFGTHAPHA
jgi:flavin reductase (DIM6/NTAB) family NADH-FMN oxidoreductase RutF